MTNEELLNLLRRGEERMKRFTDAFTLQQRPEWNDVELANRWRDQVNQLLRASLTKPAEYPAYTECQHDHMKPNPTLRATYPKHGSQSGWVQEYRCNVCQCSFERPIATAGLRANGETP